MIKYAKVINQETKQCDVGLGTNIAFYKKLGMVEMNVEQGYDGSWYVYGFAPKKPHNDIIMEQIRALESEITPRNIRAAIQGDNFALNKINKIEAEIEELRKQLE